MPTWNALVPLTLDVVCNYFSLVLCSLDYIMTELWFTSPWFVLHLFNLKFN